MKNSSFKFFLKLFLVSCILLFLSLIIIFHIHGNKHFAGVIYGYLGSLFIFTLGLISISWSFKRSLKTFMGFVIGGMVVRFLLIAGLIFIILRYTTQDIIVFILSFVAFYLIFQFFEFRFVHAMMKKGKQ